MALLKDSLIAHYKFNENTAGDNAELVTNGNFSAWSGDDPVDWTVSGEVGSDPEISEVGTGEGHGGAGTGMCNIYTTGGLVSINQTPTLIVGRKYRFSINIDTSLNGGISVVDNAHTMWTSVSYTATTGVKTFTFVATHTNPLLQIKRTTGLTDITFDDVSMKLLAVEDSSGNDHDALAQQDTSAISVAGKINTAFDFPGNSTGYIIIPDHDDFSPGAGGAGTGTPFSISVWAYMHDATNFEIASKGIYNVNGEWRFRLYSLDRVVFELYDESVTDCYIGRRYNAALTSYENQWIHLVFTYDGGNSSSGIRIYLDGVRIDDTNHESNAGSFVAVENFNIPVYIGKYSTIYTNGLIDNLMFFNKELSLLEIKYLHNSGGGVESIPTLIEMSRTGHSFSSRQEI